MNKVLDRVEALSLFTSFLLTEENFIYAKFGDGELACMNGEKGHNCDHHPYSETLGKKLKDAFYRLNRDNKQTYIADWNDDSYNELKEKFCQKFDLSPKWVFYDSMLHVSGQIDEHIYNFLKTIKETKRRKIFFGPLRLNKVEQLLDINIHIEIPLVNGFQHYDKYLDWLDENVKKDDIYIFSAGMMSKVLINDINLFEKNTTCIDMGSSFDPIFVGKTRLKQVDQNILHNFYKELIK